jgi:hypothetical protein
MKEIATTMTDEPQRKPSRVELTQRDLSVLRFIGEQYAICFDQLQRLLGAQAGASAQVTEGGKLSESASRVWLSRMRSVGAIEVEKPFRGQPQFIWLKLFGLKLAELDYDYLKPATTTLQHHYWCAETRLYLASRRPGDTWISERQLRSEQAQAARNQQKMPELPDAHLLTQRGIIAVEIELTVKQASRLTALLRKRAAEYYTIWYFTTQKTRIRVETAKKELPLDMRERVQIYALPQLDQQPGANA